jgi:hypothetical protein
MRRENIGVEDDFIAYYLKWQEGDKISSQLQGYITIINFVNDRGDNRETE